MEKPTRVLHNIILLSHLQENIVNSKSSDVNSGFS